MTAPRTIYPRQCRAARKLTRSTQKDVAQAAGVSPSALSLFERGKRQLPPDAMARLIAFFETHRVTFWLGEDQGVYFALEDGSLTGITIAEEILRS